MNKKETYQKEILKVIKDNNIFVIQDIFAFYTGIKSAQFYNLKLEKSESIKKAIDDNKIKTKHSLKNKWFKSGNFSAEVALYKLLSNEDELRKLAMSYHDLSTGGGPIGIDVKFVKRGKNTS